MDNRFPSHFQPLYDELAERVRTDTEKFLAEHAALQPHGLFARVNYFFNDTAHAQRPVYDAVSQDFSAYLNVHELQDHGVAKVRLDENYLRSIISKNHNVREQIMNAGPVLVRQP